MMWKDKKSEEEMRKFNELLKLIIIGSVGGLVSSIFLKTFENFGQGGFFNFFLSIGGFLFYVFGFTSILYFIWWRWTK